MEAISQPEYGGFNTRSATTPVFSPLKPRARAPRDFTCGVRMITTTGRTVSASGPGVPAGGVILLSDEDGRLLGRKLLLNLRRKNFNQDRSGSSHPGNGVQMMFNRDLGREAMVGGIRRTRAMTAMRRRFADD